MRSTFIRKYWPLILSLIILWSIVAVILNLSIKDNQGHLVYAQDDPYIHMAMAKNFSQHGVWGVTRYEFSSTSSSLLWTLMLSGIYYLAGVNEVAPLILNVLFASLIILSAFIILKQYEIPGFYVLVVLGGIIFITPLPALIFLGMEHTLHALITILFAYFLAKVLSRKEAPFFTIEAACLWALAPGLTLSRYEGLFLVFVAAVLLMVHKRWIYSLSLAAWASLPLIIYGVISRAHGWFWLPNSVLLKSTHPDLTSLRSILDFLLFRSEVLYQAPHLLFLIIIALALYILQFNRPRPEGEIFPSMLIIFISVGFLQVYVAQIGWFYRYEAYLVALGVLTIAPVLFEYLPQNMHKITLDKTVAPKYAAIITFSLLLVLPLSARGVIALTNLPQALNNTYHLQYQTGLFLKRYYPGATVALQDLGAVNYLADIKCLDLIGIGSIEITKLLRQKEFNLAKVCTLINKDATIAAVVHDGFFYRQELAASATAFQWSKIGQWQISGNIPEDNNKVAFYAAHPNER